MLIKAGVDISRLKPCIRKRLSCVGRVYKAHGEQMVITSTYEGTHGDGSLHYSNEAVDFGNPEEPTHGFVADFRGCFGGAYDIVFGNDHIHVEFDPK